MKKILLFMAGTMILGLSITASSMAAGTITNTAEVGYKDAGGDTYTASDTCALTVMVPPNIAIEKNGWNVTQEVTPTYTDPVAGSPGDVIEYQVVLTNDGEDTAKFVVMMDALPDSVTFQVDAYGTGKGIKVDGLAQTNAQGDDKANYDGGANTVTVGKNEASDNGNTTEITIDGGASVTILYRVEID